jgi:hypothetical protein
MQASVAIAEAQQAQLAKQRAQIETLESIFKASSADVETLRELLGKSEAETANWKKQFDDVDARNKAMIEADPVKVYAQDGPDKQASITVVCRVDRQRLLRRPDKVFDAFGRRVGAELNAKFKELLDELRLADSKAQAAATYREG